MKSIEIDDDLYHFIAANTQHIGESASDILRRMVMPGSVPANQSTSKADTAQEVAIRTPDQSPEVSAECHAQAVLEELDGQQLLIIPKMVERWLLVLSVIYKHHTSAFAKVLGMSGRNRTYFATDKDTLLETGSSTNPKNVPGSEYWVITNNNTVKKINMLKEVAQVLGFNEQEVTQLINIFAPEHI
ncbi:replication initiation negative regulator SeqA [Paraglaciecola aquimarina]|uniref:Negative modulator of initiation of replication n=1 Tax=Paraglaciecola algarum TaxID=3050085 RepID=A0ABS9D9R1_9ALTE|nr:replication initiation negative regulator SeqA [Paraglaciecola sp. G1-23]MCF2949698.1 replication initiation negative regulator SeqA [Paraglaciecola sp. G1-23]